MAAKAAKRSRSKKPVRLRDRVRGVDPRRTQHAYMQSLTAERHALARKLDRKAYDEYWADRFIALFPGV